MNPLKCSNPTGPACSEWLTTTNLSKTRLARILAFFVKNPEYAAGSDGNEESTI